MAFEGIDRSGQSIWWILQESGIESVQCVFDLVGSRHGRLIDEELGGFGDGWGDIEGRKDAFQLLERLVQSR